MIVIPAVDLMDGDAVQLVGGEPGSERVRVPDPAAVAGRWLDAGFRHLHVVDLDAALGRGSNLRAVAAIARRLRDEAGPAGDGPRGAAVLEHAPPWVSAPSTPRSGDGPQPDAAAAAPWPADGPQPQPAAASLQVGGGLRDDAGVVAAFEMGADRVIVGTRGVTEHHWLERLAGRHPGRVILAADVRDDEVVVSGWREGAGLSPVELLDAVAHLPLAAVLVTDVGREGRMEGADARRFAALRRATSHPLLAAGGIGSMDDLRVLDTAGIAGAVVGMALYTGAIDPEEAAAAFGNGPASGTLR